ncbi:DMT family transporter [Geomonas azotofigens]|uniref:DMT family transporter n=1 Tax=Geomonas azotofigens TaxID=2843196 RepID=UPI001C108BAD|nr:DMT family transporter [Geomonas azotofigens]MBU5613006.1 DMT family transporter [Geomonas azotofigens]
MQAKTIKSDLLLLLIAAIWGGGFVAQRKGLDFLGPFSYNGVRFALGSLSLLPLVYLNRRRLGPYHGSLPQASTRALIHGGLMAGGALFMGASLQQVGIAYTTAGNAGFITGLYVVLVPLLGTFWGQRPSIGTWLGAVLAAAGLFFLSVTDHFTIGIGDLLELIGAVFWAGHVLLIGWLSPRLDPFKLSALQFAVCSVLSLITAFVFESMTLTTVVAAWRPILYGGLISVGFAYTMQVVAQRDAHPAHTAVILSAEGVFAATWGWFFLGEVLGSRGLLGCALMLAGILCSELCNFVIQVRSSAKTA